MQFNQSLNKLFDLADSSMQLKLDVLDIVAGIRPVARIILEKNLEANHCVPLLLELNLAVCVGRTCSMKRGLTNFIDYDVDINDNGTQDFVILYISKEKKLANEARESDNLV